MSRKTAITFYLEAERAVIIKEMAKQYNRSLSGLLQEAVELIIRNKPKLDETYLKSEVIEND